MVETNSRKQAIINLDFLLSLGLIQNDDLRNNVRKAIDDSLRVALVNMAEDVANGTVISHLNEYYENDTLV